jgi:hypothetical protein
MNTAANARNLAILVPSPCHILVAGLGGQAALSAHPVPVEAEWLEAVRAGSAPKFITINGQPFLLGRASQQHLATAASGG